MKNFTMSERCVFMKRLIVITVFFALTACPTLGSAQQLKTGRLAKKLYVIGHRGAAGLSPENTLTAFRRALETGVDALEMDVLLTADKEVVVHHDFRLKPEITRKPDGSWLEAFSRPNIRELTLAELKTYDVGRLRPHTGYARRYPEQQPADGEHIPTLVQVISLLREMNNESAELWIEIKTSPEEPDMTPSPETVADAVVQILREKEVSSRTRILSFDWRSLVHVQKIAPRIPTVYLSHTGIRLNNIKAGRPGASPWMAGLDIDDFDGSVPRAVEKAGGRYWAPHYKTITYQALEEAHRLGIQVFVWTPDSPQEMQRFMEMGIDGIVTNRPDLLKSLLSGS